MFCQVASTSFWQGSCSSIYLEALDDSRRQGAMWALHPLRGDPWRPATDADPQKPRSPRDIGGRVRSSEACLAPPEGDPY